MPRRHNDGFTFVETLIALLICALLVSAVCTALIHVLRTERSSLVMRETPLLLQTLACRTYLDPESPKNVSERLPDAWSADHEMITLANGDETRTPWQVWSLVPAADPGFIYSLSLRAALGPW